MKRIFTEEELTLVIEALEAQLVDVKEEIVEAEADDAADSVVFALSKDMVATTIMKQFFENVQEQDDCMFAEGCTEQVAMQMSAFTEKKKFRYHMDFK